MIDITQHEETVFSQNGEDGILDFVFRTIGTTNKFCVEFGAANGRECTTRWLRETQGWTGLLLDEGYADTVIHREHVTAENINTLFARYQVPSDFDLLSIDIDGNDYYVWKAISGYRPRVVVIEYNAHISPDESLAIAYEPRFRWNRDRYYGASLLALTRLGARNNYMLIGCDSRGVNAFFVDIDAAAGHFVPREPRDVYRPPGFGVVSKGRHIGHRVSTRTFVQVES